MKKNRLPVEWRLPNKKRPFTYSTVATSLLIKVLYDEYKDLRLVYNAINYDEDAKQIVKYYIDNGIYQVNIE